MVDENNEQLTTADVAGMGSRNNDVRSDEMTDTRSDSDGSGDRFAARDSTADETQAPLFPTDQAQGFRSRWDSIQASFVDEPRSAVEQADSLIAEVMKSLATSFADERENLERQWDHGDDVSTEDLRIGLRRYRSFFDRLLSV
jgi:hypothetical protein